VTSTQMQKSRALKSRYNLLITKKKLPLESKLEIKINQETYK